MPAQPVTFLAARATGMAPDLPLVGLLYLPEPGPADARLPGLVVAHGAGSTARRHQEFCLEASRHGFAVLALDFRGHGDSSGTADGPLHLDILAAVDFLRDQPSVDPARICFRGSSMGGFYGVKAAAEAGFATMALLCPASETTMLKAIAESPTGAETATTDRPADTGVALARRDTEAGGATTDDARSPTRWNTPRTKAFFEGEDSLQRAATVDCPVLLVHARGDDVVPLAHSLALVRHLRTDTVLMALEGGTHTTAQHSPEVHHLVVQWLMERVELH